MVSSNFDKVHGDKMLKLGCFLGNKMLNNQLKLISPKWWLIVMFSYNDGY